MRTVDFTGTVSQATMRPQDVLPACMDVLETFYSKMYNEIASDILDEFGVYYHYLHVCTTDCCLDEYLECESHDRVWQSEFISYILNEDIWNAMNEIAPSGYYFGSHPGDGSDYGYWMIEEEALEENN